MFCCALIVGEKFVPGDSEVGWRLQIIDKFAVYNSDGFMSTLELLPMWQNVDPDVELFGSGIISQLDDEDSVWGTGHALNNLSTLPLLTCKQASVYLTSGLARRLIALAYPHCAISVGPQRFQESLLLLSQAM